MSPYVGTDERPTPMVGDSGSGGRGGTVPAPPAGSGALGWVLKADGDWEAESGGNSFTTIAVSGQANVVADSSTDTLTLAAGSNVTLTTNAGTDTVTIASSPGSSFGTVAVSGQSDVVADSANDTLTLAAGANVTITTTAGSDTVTIAAAAAGNSFGTVAVSGQSDVVADQANDTLTIIAGANVTVTTSAAGDSVTIAATAGAAGALVLLEQYTASATATLDFTTCITSTYDEYLFEFVNLVPATDGALLWMRMSTDGGSTYDTSAIYSHEQFAWRAAATAVSGNTGQTKIVLMNGGLNNSASWGLTGSIRLYSPLHATLFKSIRGFVKYLTVTSLLRISNEIAGTYESATAVNAVRFLFDTGNIASGTIRCYGLAK